MTKAQFADLSKVFQSPVRVVHFRDLPFSAVAGCFVPGDEDDEACWEEECRDRAARIYSLPMDSALFDCPLPPSGCLGPFYAFDGRVGNTCQHLIVEKLGEISRPASGQRAEPKKVRAERVRQW